MTTSVRPTPSAASSRTTLRSVGAVVAGFVAMAVLAGIVDQILHWLGVFPPWGQITYEAGPYSLAVLYRAVFGVFGAWLTAKLAPRAPLRHALWLGIVGVVLSLAGTVAALTHDLGPLWYPVVLVLIALPAAWLGGKIYIARAESARSIT